MTVSNGKEMSPLCHGCYLFSLCLRLPTEPGYYADGEWGIRIENVAIVRDVKTRHNFGGNGYLGLERVTMVRFIFHSATFGSLTDVLRDSALFRRA